MTDESQIDFENILFPKNDEPKKDGERVEGLEVEIKKIKTEDHDEYCAQCDRGDFCTKHTTRAA
jgi:hypothetical protein